MRLIPPVSKKKSGVKPTLFTPQALTQPFKQAWRRLLPQPDCSARHCQECRCDPIPFSIPFSSSLRRLFTLVKSPADFASINNGKSPDSAVFGMTTASIGMLTVFPALSCSIVTFIRKANVPGPMALNFVASPRGKLLIAPGFQPCRNACKLPFLLAVAYDRIRHGTAKPVSDNRCRAINLSPGWFLFSIKPHKNIGISYFFDDQANLFDLVLKLLL